MQMSVLQDDWYKRAELALQNGKEDLAREALERRQSFQVRDSHISQQFIHIL